MKKDIPKKRGTVFRKVLSLMTVILLLCSVLTSCSGKTPEGETKTGPPDAASDASPEPGVTTAAPKPTGPPLTATGETNWQAVLKQSAAVVYLTLNPELAL